jgi:dsRNA-specific ribonuclease
VAKDDPKMLAHLKKNPAYNGRGDDSGLAKHAPSHRVHSVHVHVHAHAHGHAHHAHPVHPKPTRARISIEDVTAIIAKYVGRSTDPRPTDPAIYQRALVHRSCSGVASSGHHSGKTRHEETGTGAASSSPPASPSSYERLEFLGDAVLSLLTAAYLYERYPSENEGFLSRMRTRLVNGKALAALCANTPLPAFVVAQTAAQATASETLEDVFEAFLGAVYLDLGIDVARAWLIGIFEEHVDFAELAANQDTAKAVLNRHCMRQLGFLPMLEQLPHVSVYASPQQQLLAISPSSSSAAAAGEERPPPQIAVRFRHPTSGAVISTGYGASLRDAEDQAIRRARTHYNI